MARRRRKGNPLLTKIVVVSVLAHAIILPVAAHFGAFEKLKREFGTSRVVMVSLPPVEAEKPKAAPKTVKKRPAVKKGATNAPKATAAQKAGVPEPKVVASSGPATGDGGGPTVDANATGKAGALPPGATGGTPPAQPAPAPTAPAPTPEPKPEPPAPIPAPKPELAPAPTPKPEPASAPKPRRIVEAVPTESPEPTIPDELRTEPFEKTLVVEADVDTGGHPTNIRVAESTGVKALDAAGLDAARRYRFRPATVDDEPVEQHIRFRIIFKVE